MISEIELTIAREAAAHTLASAELNPYADAEVLEIGDARVVYSGALSPVHGVYGLGLDGPVEERDFREIEKFFLKKERTPAFWVCPKTDESLLPYLKNYKVTKTESIHGASLQDKISFPSPIGNSSPNHDEWLKLFSHDKELLAFTKIHQKETRFYTGLNAASYTFFSRGIALVPYPLSSLLAIQWDDAKKFQCRYFASIGAETLPKIYERNLYVI